MKDSGQFVALPPILKVSDADASGIASEHSLSQDAFDNSIESVLESEAAKENLDTVDFGTVLSTFFLFRPDFVSAEK